MFGAVFFIAVGMALDPRQVLAQWPEVLAFAALVLLGKTIAVSLGAFLLGHGVQTSIAGLGAATGVGGGTLTPVVVGVSLLTTLATPWMARRSQATAARLEAALPATSGPFSSRRDAAGGPGRRALDLRGARQIPPAPAPVRSC